MSSDVGSTLKATREQLGISLDQLSRSTKINLPTLRALENNDFDHLPRGIFVRGFLRAYAREIGLDPEDTVRSYLGRFEQPPEERAEASIGHNAWARSWGRLVGDSAVDLEGRRATLRRMVPVAATFALWLMGYLALGGGGGSPTAVYDAGEDVETLALRDAASDAVATSGQAPSPVPAIPVVDRVRVELEALGPCWIAATADGTVVIYQLLPAGERRVIEANRELVMRIGDPAALAYRVNGVRGRSLGPEGEAVTVHIDPRNAHTLIDP